MTTQTAIFDGLPTGLTLTGKAFDTDSPDTEVTGNTIAVTEGTNAKGRYSVVITRATVLAAGDYDIRLFSGLVPIAVGAFRFAGTNAETAVEVPQAVELDSASRLAIWNTLTTETFTADSFGELLLISDGTNGREVKVTGANHIAADVHEFQAGVITAGDFAANSITASALATDAVTEIQNGLATSAALATESGKITNIENASGYLLAVLAGACADPQTASETYAITVFGSTFTVDMAGQTSTGTRTAPTLTKT